MKSTGSSWRRQVWGEVLMPREENAAKLAGSSNAGFHTEAGEKFGWI